MEYTKIMKVHVAEAGTLSSLLLPCQASQVEVLILSGYLNIKDFDDVIAASVNTFVVSWNEAADKKLSVAREAFVIPRSALL